MRYLLAIFLLGLLVALHELGHLLAARACRMKVERYALGFGPPLLAFRRRGTEYSLRAIPFGGFVRIAGMEPSPVPRPGGFAARPRWQQALVIVAGAAVNAACALGLQFALYAGGRTMPVPGMVGEVVPGSEAARVQLRPGDEVLAVDGRPLERWSDLARAVAESRGPLALTIRRDRQELEVQVTPRSDPSGVLRLGVGQMYAYRKLPLARAAGHAFRHTGALFAGTVSGAWDILRGKPGPTLEGPVGIARRAAGASTAGLEALLELLAAISVALAVFNLLPVPGLDGGRLVLIAIGAVRGKPLDARVEALATAAGFLLLVALALWVTVRDVRDLRPRPASDSGAPVPRTGALDAGTPVDAGAVR